MKRLNLKLIAGVVLLMAALTFGVQNAGVVEVKFFGWQFPSSLALVVGVALTAGFIAGWALTSALGWKRRRASADGRISCPELPPVLRSRPMATKEERGL